MTVEDVSNQTDHFSHGKGSKDRSDPEAFDVAEEEEVSPAVTARQVTSKVILTLE